jgi:ribosomal protein L18
MSYKKRTCEKCGWTDIQPNMYRRKIQKKVGHGSDSTTTMHILGWLFGNKTSTKKLTKNIFGNNKRSYTSYRQVWYCHRCVR